MLEPKFPNGSVQESIKKHYSYVQQWESRQCRQFPLKLITWLRGTVLAQHSWSPKFSPQGHKKQQQKKTMLNSGVTVIPAVGDWGRKTEFEYSLAYKVRPSQQTKLQKKKGQECSLVEECFSSMHKAVSTIPSTGEKKKQTYCLKICLWIYYIIAFEIHW
jgi:hypothetical protein